MLYTTGKKEEAMQEYNQALKLDPAFVDAYNNRGILLRRIGKQ